MKISKEKLDIEMARKCLNIFDICKNAEMKYQQFRKIYNGNNCKPSTVGRIAAALGVDVTDIIELETKEGV